MTDTSNITLVTGGGADCHVCHTGLMPGGNFGPITREKLVGSFIVDHTIHDKKGNPAGLTPTGRPSKAYYRTIFASRKDQPND